MGGIRITHNRAEYRRVMKGAGVRQLLGITAARVRARAESASGLHFGCGVDVGPVSAHGWVGANNVNPRTGRPNAGLHARQAEALRAAIRGM